MASQLYDTGKWHPAEHARPFESVVHFLETKPTRTQKQFQFTTGNELYIEYGGPRRFQFTTETKHETFYRSCHL